MAFLSNIFGNANDRYLKSLQPTVDHINKLEPGLKVLSDVELKTKTVEFKKRLAEGQTLDKGRGVRSDNHRGALTLQKLFPHITAGRKLESKSRKPGAVNKTLKNRRHRGPP